MAAGRAGGCAPVGLYPVRRALRRVQHGIIELEGRHRARRLSFRARSGCAVGTLRAPSHKSPTQIIDTVPRTTACGVMTVTAVSALSRAPTMGWLSNARRHEQLLSPAAPAAKTASRVSAAGLRAYDGDGDHLDRRAARPTERAARDAKPRGVLADSPFDVPGPMLISPERKPRTKARMTTTTTKTSRSLEDENASLRDELARAREDLMAERARADALASRLEALEMMATTAVVVPPAMARDGGLARGTSSAPVEERAERRWNPFGTPPTKGADAMGDGGEDLRAARRLFANSAGVPDTNNATPDRSRHSFDPFVRPAGSDRVVRVPSPTGGRMIQIRAR